MIMPSIFKQAQQVQNPGITALQTGMYNFIWNIRRVLQITTSGAGLLNYFRRYLANLEKTYPKEHDRVTGTLNQFTIDNFTVLRDKIIPRLASKNLAEDIKKDSSGAEWYPTMVYYGENVIKLFAPILALISSVGTDAASLEANGKKIGDALTNVGDAFYQLTIRFITALQESKSRKPITADERFKRLKKISEDLVDPIKSYISYYAFDDKEQPMDWNDPNVQERLKNSGGGNKYILFLHPKFGAMLQDTDWLGNGMVYQYANKLSDDDREQFYMDKQDAVVVKDGMPLSEFNELIQSYGFDSVEPDL